MPVDRESIENAEIFAKGFNTYLEEWGLEGRKDGNFVKYFNQDDDLVLKVQYDSEGDSRKFIVDIAEREDERLHEDAIHRAKDFFVDANYGHTSMNYNGVNSVYRYKVNPDEGTGDLPPGYRIPGEGSEIENGAPADPYKGREVEPLFSFVTDGVEKDLERASSEVTY